MIKENIDRERIYSAERRLLMHSGMEWERFKIYNVQIDDHGNYIRTIELGDPTK